MKKLKIAFLFFFFIISQADAQFARYKDGKPATEISYTNVTGTPYLYDYWSPGVVELKDGRSYKDVALKYDACNNELIFKNPKDDAVLAFADPVKSFGMEHAGVKEVFSNGFSKIDGFDEETFYQVLYGGGTKLLYKLKKNLMETKPYNSATVERSFNINVFYYLVKDGAIQRFKPSKKEFLVLFKDKSADVETFIRKEHIDFKNNNDLVKVLEFYYSL